MIDPRELSRLCLDASVFTSIYICWQCVGVGMWDGLELEFNLVVLQSNSIHVLLFTSFFTPLLGNLFEIPYGNKSYLRPCAAASILGGFPAHCRGYEGEI